MKRQSLKERIYAYLKRHPEWIAKGNIADLARSATGATGEHTGRRLRELHEEGKVEVDYRTNNGARHAFYRAR